MPRPVKDISGQRFGSLVAVRVEMRAGRRPLWHCRCDCGGTATATNGELRAARRTACATCAARNLHGNGSGDASPNYRHGGAIRGAHTKEYRAWSSMIRRCELRSQRSYPLYGGRGITVCAEWRHDFPAFLRDVGEAPTRAHTIDRIDPDGNYEPGNVRWATAKEQAINKRATKRFEHDGASLTIAEWADRIGVKYQTLWARIHVHHMPLTQALR